jgi:hypothetical protein
MLDRRHDTQPFPPLARSVGPSVSLRDTFVAGGEVPRKPNRLKVRAGRAAQVPTPRSPEFRDGLKAIVAVHLNCPDAITVAPEMYNASRRKIVIGLIVDSLAMCA